GAGAKRADADLLSPEPFDVFYFRFRVQPVHGPVETNKDKFKWSAAGNRANDAGTARDEVDVAPKQRHVGHSRSHENKLHVQIVLSEVAFLLSNDHRQHRLAKSRDRHLYLSSLCDSRKTNQHHKTNKRFRSHFLSHIESNPRETESLKSIIR